MTRPQPTRPNPILQNRDDPGPIGTERVDDPTLWEKVIFASTMTIAVLLAAMVIIMIVIRFPIQAAFVFGIPAAIIAFWYHVLSARR